MLSATVLVDSPVTAANGMASPATSTPMTAATATMTPRWDTTLAGRRRSVRREGMAPRVREPDTTPLIADRATGVTHLHHPAWRHGWCRSSHFGLRAVRLGGTRSSHPHQRRSGSAFGGALRTVRLNVVVRSDYQKLLPLCLFRAVQGLYLFTRGLTRTARWEVGPSRKGQGRCGTKTGQSRLCATRRDRTSCSCEAPRRTVPSRCVPVDRCAPSASPRRSTTRSSGASGAG